MVGECVAGCVVLPPTPLTANISLLNDVRQRTNVARATTIVQKMGTTLITNIYFIVNTEQLIRPLAPGINVSTSIPT